MTKTANSVSVPAKQNQTNWFDDLVDRLPELLRAAANLFEELTREEKNIIVIAIFLLFLMPIRAVTSSVFVSGNHAFAEKQWTFLRILRVIITKTAPSLYRGLLGPCLGI